MTQSVASLEYNKEYDVIVVGAGPGSIFATLTLVEKIEDQLQKDIKIAIFEKGPPIEKRSQKIDLKNSSILNGWGGAGAFSDGKLTLSPDVGGYLEKNELISYINEVEKQFIRFGAPTDRLFEAKGAEIEELKRKSLRAGVELVPYKILHIGTDNAAKVLKNIYYHLTEKYNVDVYFYHPVKELLAENGKIIGVRTEEGIFSAPFVIVGVGREGAHWLRAEAIKLGLKITNNPVDVGVRVEIPAEIAAPLTDALYEFKLKYYAPTFDQFLRTFCVNPYGYVTMEVAEGGQYVTVNGHSYADPSKRSQNTNFAILVSSKFTTPFNDPIAYGRSIAKLANLLSGGKVLIQRLADLKKGRRSTPEKIKRSIITPTLKEAVPGDLSFVLPYRHLKSILEFIEALDALIPGINGSNTFLYGVETKFYSSKIDVHPTMESKQVKNLYVVGDGAGITRSLVQSSVSGMVAANAIIQKIKKEAYLQAKI